MQELLQSIMKEDNSSLLGYTRKFRKLYKRLDKNEKRKTFDLLIEQSYYFNKLGHTSHNQFGQLFDRIHQVLPDGLKFLIDIRADLLDIIDTEKRNNSASSLYTRFSDLEQDIRLKLKEYITKCLKLEQIKWQNTSGDILEKICTYEAVHAVQDWKDLKRRLGPDRRVYGLFFEDSLNKANEPLVFIHVALVPELSTSIQDIINAKEFFLDNDEEEDRVMKRQQQTFKYAICYSITTQKGLGGIHLGHYLIKKAIENLKQTHHQIHTFATLSPIPGFRTWLNNNIHTIIQAEFNTIKNWKMV
ncbi:malonyl-CoA decarboxylase [Cokeromyces recurvatus]|uniref:malonyl-CoA decarboxylase n=1 Tax=Cokeromyces recurvatus TaxID=90255 RepID=UPI00221EB3AD|nr:malonyl-CoA decarboxylase [Cokeromyces recurvatus]KAI7903216.1 malonyl-CoA decarboxylase [Cokeromyces recurvatus]